MPAAVIDARPVEHCRLKFDCRREPSTWDAELPVGVNRLDARCDPANGQHAPRIGALTIEVLRLERRAAG
jgi:hypothetical protein